MAWVLFKVTHKGGRREEGDPGQVGLWPFPPLGEGRVWRLRGAPARIAGTEVGVEREEPALGPPTVGEPMSPCEGEDDFLDDRAIPCVYRFILKNKSQSKNRRLCCDFLSPGEEGAT